MTVEKFITEAEGYFGRYKPVVRGYVMQWFATRRLSETMIGFVWAETMKHLSSTFRTPPDIEALERAYREARNRPELDPLLRKPVLQIPENMLPPELAMELLEELTRSLAAGEDPRQNDRLQAIASGRMN